MRSLALAVGLFLVAQHNPTTHKPAPHNPAPPDSTGSDWQHLRTYVVGQTRDIHGNVELFTKLTQPYAPLDLTITHGDLKSVQSSRDAFYGMAGAAAGLSRDAILRRLDNFRSDQRNPSDLANDLVLQLPALRSLIHKFSTTAPELLIIADWGVPGDLRLNNSFLQHSAVTTYLEHDGYIPYPPGVPFHSLDAELSANHLTHDDLDAIVSSMRSLHIVALLKMPIGVRAIYSGVTHNEIGLLFLNSGEAPPRVGDRWGNGIEVSSVTAIAPDVFLYVA